MSAEDQLTRCHNAVADLNRNRAWGLGPSQVAAYAQALAALVAEQSPDDTQLALISANYHHDHALIEALTDSANPGHTRAWQELGAQARRILASKGAYAMLAEGAFDLEDLAQEAMADLWRGMGKFRYQSRLQTWMFAVVSHCLGKAARRLRAQKRGALPTAHSLEALQAAEGEPIGAHPPLATDTAALLGLLTDLLARTLARQTDQRLGVVLQLWAVEQQTLREIGARMGLSVGRVHSLLAQAQAALRADPDLQAWIEEAHDEVGAARREPPGPAMPAVVSAV